MSSPGHDELRRWREQGRAPAGSCPFCASRISVVERDGVFVARCSHRGCGARGPKHHDLTRACDLFCCPPQRTAGGMEESLASASDTCRAELEAELREVEAETIATVVAWLRDQRQKTMTMPVSDAREAEDAKLVCGILGDSADAIARGDWSRDCGARRGEKEASDGES